MRKGEKGLMHVMESHLYFRCHITFSCKGEYKLGIIYFQKHAGGCGLTWWKTPHSPTGPWAALRRAPTWPTAPWCLLNRWYPWCIPPWCPWRSLHIAIMHCTINIIAMIHYTKMHCTVIHHEALHCSKAPFAMMHFTIMPWWTVPRST